MSYQLTQKTKDILEEINNVIMDGNLIRLFLTMEAAVTQVNESRMQTMPNHERWQMLGGILMAKASSLAQDVAEVLNASNRESTVIHQQLLGFISRETAIQEEVLIYDGVGKLEREIMHLNVMEHTFPAHIGKISGARVRVRKDLAAAWQKADGLLRAEYDSPGTVTQVAPALPPPPAGGTPDALSAAGAHQSPSAGANAVKRSLEQAGDGASPAEHDATVVPAAKRVRVGSTPNQASAKQPAPIWPNPDPVTPGTAPAWKALFEKMPNGASRMTPEDRLLNALSKLSRPGQS